MKTKTILSIGKDGAIITRMGHLEQELNNSHIPLLDNVFFDLGDFFDLNDKSFDLTITTNSIVVAGSDGKEYAFRYQGGMENMVNRIYNLGYQDCYDDVLTKVRFGDHPCAVTNVNSYFESNHYSFLGRMLTYKHGMVNVFCNTKQILTTRDNNFVFPISCAKTDNTGYVFVLPSLEFRCVEVGGEDRYELVEDSLLKYVAKEWDDLAASFNV